MFLYSTVSTLKPKNTKKDHQKEAASGDKTRTLETQRLAYCWDSCDNLAQFEFVQNGGLAGGIQTNHEYPHLFLAEEALE